MPIGVLSVEGLTHGNIIPLSTMSPTEPVRSRAAWKFLPLRIKAAVCYVLPLPLLAVAAAWGSGAGAVTEPDPAVDGAAVRGAYAEAADVDGP